jgi:tRNA C32,U32 (ribose-2'-O)-methylase TrmJ
MILSALVASLGTKNQPQAREVDGLIEHFERATAHSGFLDPKNPMLGMARLRRLFNRARVDRVEINILRGILNSIEKMDPSNQSTDCSGELRFDQRRAG